MSTGDIKLKDEFIVPSGLQHGLDAAVDHQTGVYEYRYNYLSYEFEHEGDHVSARAYLDQPSQVSVLTPIQPERTLHREVLVFLASRFREIQQLTPTAYEPLPAELAAEVEREAMSRLPATKTA